MAPSAREQKLEATREKKTGEKEKAMMMHPYFMLEHVRVRQEALLFEAERGRLLRSARAARKAARAARAAVVPPRESQTPRAASTLASCGRHVAGSAR